MSNTPLMHINQVNPQWYGLFRAIPQTVCPCIAGMPTDGIRLRKRIELLIMMHNTSLS